MNEIYEFGSFRLEVRERRLTFEGSPIPLRPKVLDTLCALVARHGKLVDKDELMKLVWPDTVVEENNLALNVTILRKAFRDADPTGKWIETICYSLITHPNPEFEQLNPKPSVKKRLRKSVTA